MQVYCDLDSASESYVDLRSKAHQALEDGHFSRASKLFEWSLTEARRLGDPLLIERARCNRAAAAIELGMAAPVLGELQEVLASSRDLGSRFLAAHLLASAFTVQGMSTETERYVRLAQELAQRMGRPNEMGSSSMKLGLLYLGGSRPQEAQRHIERAVQELTEGSPEALALARSNLGYCLCQIGRSRRGFRLLEEGAETLAELRYGLYEKSARLNLGFALIDREEFEAALDQADRVLSLTCAAYERKYALYLAGEACTAMDLRERAREHFSLLQREFYPEMPFLIEMLMSVGTHRLVSWHA